MKKSTTVSHRYDLMPLLPSDPGGVTGSWSYRHAKAKVGQRF